jgi:hypothetical protein
MDGFEMEREEPRALLELDAAMSSAKSAGVSRAANYLDSRTTFRGRSFRMMQGPTINIRKNVRNAIQRPKMNEAGRDLQPVHQLEGRPLTANWKVGMRNAAGRSR